jgi:hypothetical protein
MKKFLLLLTICAFVWSCSDSKEKEELEGTSLTSRLLAPNNVDPIFDAKVVLTKNGEILSETTTGIDGNFTVNNVQSGTHTISITKGLFSAERTFDADEYEDEILDFILDNLPNIAVVTGHFDNIQSVLYDIGLVNPETGEPLFDIIDGVSFERLSSGHGHHGNAQVSRTNEFLAPNVDFSFGDLISDPAMLAQYDVVFLNCGLTTSQLEHSSNLTDYVANGGVLYATDYAYEYLFDVTNDGQDYITFLDPYKSGISLQTEATIMDADLALWLEINYGISVNNTVLIDEFLSAWQVVDSFDDTTVLNWFNGEVTYGTNDGEVTENKDLMFTFLHGDRAILYSSYNTENHDEGFSDVDRIMEYQVFNLGDH